MLAIRLQRTGRSGHAQYRMIVQDARKSPTSGKIVTSLGSYNPHTKSVVIDKEKASLFLSNGAQPSPRVVSLLVKEGVKIPDWAQKLAKKERAIKNTNKLRKNRPAGEPAPEAPAEVVTEVPTTVDEAPAEVAVSEAAVAEEVAPEVVETAEVVTEAEVPAEASDEVAQSSVESEDSGVVEEPAVADAMAEEPKPKA